MRSMASPASTELPSHWKPGTAPVAVVMISLNEGHHLEAVLQNLQGWAQEVFLVDSYSSDQTVDLALKYGVHVVQRRFRGFGDQWNFALQRLPINAPWTLKLDPDERLSPEIKRSIEALAHESAIQGMTVTHRLWFMGKPLPVRHQYLRVWRTGACRFSDVSVNEHARVEGPIALAHGLVEHLDSPDLHHWLEKQNSYTTAEAKRVHAGEHLAEKPRFWGSRLQRRMWLKQHFTKVPGRFTLIFLAHYLLMGAWRAGRVGWIWARLRTEVYRLWEYKMVEMELTGRMPLKRSPGPAGPDPRVPQFE